MTTKRKILIVASLLLLTCFSLFGSVKAISSPITLSTKSLTNLPTRISPQRRIFNDTTRVWAFWSNGTDLVYRTTTDFSSWTVENKSVLGIARGYWFSVRSYLLGSVKCVYLIYVTSEAKGNILYFVRANISNDYNLLYGATSTVYTATSTRTVHKPDIDVTTTGKLIVGFHVGYNDTFQSLLYFRATNPNNDGSGSWTTSSTSWGTFTLTNNAGLAGVVRLTNGRAYVAFTRFGIDSYSYGYLWNGTTWGSRETIVSTEGVFYGLFTINAYLDNVTYGYADYTNNPLFRLRFYGNSTWSSSETITSAYDIDGVCTSTINATSGDYWLFAPNGTNPYQIIYAKRTWTTKVWSSFSLWLYDTNMDYYGIIAYDKIYDNVLGTIWTTGVSSPFSIMFSYHDFAAVSITIITVSLTDTSISSESLTFCAIFGLTELTITTESPSFIKYVVFTVYSYSATTEYLQRITGVTTGALISVLLLTSIIGLCLFVLKRRRNS